MGTVIEVTSVKNILCGGREEGVCFCIRLTAPPIISDTLVTGMGGGAVGGGIFVGLVC